MTQDERVRVFVGSGEASLLERKTLIHSLRKNTQKPLDVYVFNGTHNSIELNDGEPFLAPMSLKVKYQNITEFSLYRYLIPEICNFQGKAIYLDSDTICLTDIGTLFETPVSDYDFLAKKDAYAGTDLWGLSVMLINCDKCRFDLELILDEIDRGFYSLADFTGMSQAFLERHSYRIAALDPQWNVFDYWNRRTHLIHYTNLHTQPWKYQNHPYGELWFEYFQEALESGYITVEDVKLSIDRGYVRRNLLKGNFSTVGSSVNTVKKALSFLKPLLAENRRRLGVFNQPA